VLWIFIAFKNPSLSAGFEPVNLGSSGKHDNHYTTKNDWVSRLRNTDCVVSEMTDYSLPRWKAAWSGSEQG
jgi:hypothetical protein